MEKNKVNEVLENGLEMDSLQPDKRTRFQVNKVEGRNSRHDNGSLILNLEEATDDDDLHSVTDRTRLNSEGASKSLRHLTREALPRLDNYRNIMSIQAANRPTLDELHNSTLPLKIESPFHLNGKASPPHGTIKFGWIKGVLIRCLLNIWGVMLFLRLTWVVGQAGIGEAILIILTSTLVTVVTSLSMSAISTNGVIKGGGTYYMISRSLGPEFGGSIGLILSLANAVACAMYVVGFCESVQDLLNTYGLHILGDKNDIRIIGCITIVILTGIVVVGLEWEAKAQIVLLVILLVAIADFLLGSFLGPLNEDAKAKGFVGFNGTVAYENWFPDYRPDKSGTYYNFFTVFSIFFPAATGILAGANISGDLKDPESAIPKGTLLAILITTLSYILMAVFAGCSVVRDAIGPVTSILNATSEVLLLDNNSTNTNFTDGLLNQSISIDLNNSTTESTILLDLVTLTNTTKYGLINNFQVVELVSWQGSLIYAGCFAATLSSALASLVSAPKVFQALCKDKLYPGIEWFGKGYGQNDEPIRGYVLTFIIAVAFILIGDLNAIAPLISNFFLAAYTLINFSTFHASLAKPVGWRPRFKYYNMWLSLAGSIVCVLVMFLISWGTALFTFTVVLALYLIVSYRKPNVNWGSTTQAQTYKNALQAVHQLNTVEEHVKNYRPQILVLSGMPSARPALVDFAHLITKNLSLLVCGHVNSSQLPQRVRNVLNYKANSWFKAHKLKAFYIQVDGVQFDDGCRSILKASGLGKLRPNILLMGYKSDWQTCPREELTQYFDVLHNAFDLHLGVGLLRLQQGFNMSDSAQEEDSKTKNFSEHMPRSRSFSQISQASSNDSYYTSTPKHKIHASPNPQEENFDKKTKSVTESAPDFPNSDDTNEFVDRFFFQKKQKRDGTIDVWWLYDDGGLTLLLPYIVTTRKNWSNCKLRVFALANKRDELELEHRNMASLLAKFRIDYSDLQVVPDITSKPLESTENLFQSLIADFKTTDENIDTKNLVAITESELMAVKDKTNRHLRLRELLLQHSREANLVVVTLPIPRKNIVSAPLYLAWLEVLTRDMPPILLVRGNQTSVLTFYS